MLRFLFIILFILKNNVTFFVLILFFEKIALIRDSVVADKMRAPFAFSFFNIIGGENITILCSSFAATLSYYVPCCYYADNIMFTV